MNLLRRPFVLLTLGAILLAAFVVLLMTALPQYFAHREAALVEAPSPVAEPLPPPPEPHLQTDPAATLEKLRAQEDARLNGYGWVDRQKQLVHIPIDTAIDVLLQTGLPARKQARKTPGE
jgi:hypothetical protein